MISCFLLKQNEHFLYLFQIKGEQWFVTTWVLFLELSPWFLSVTITLFVFTTSGILFECRASAGVKLASTESVALWVVALMLLNPLTYRSIGWLMFCHHGGNKFLASENEWKVSPDYDHCHRVSRRAPKYSLEHAKRHRQ